MLVGECSRFQEKYPEKHLAGLKLVEARLLTVVTIYFTMGRRRLRMVSMLH